MNERGEVVGFADDVTAGEGGTAADFAKNDDALLAAGRLFRELIANGGGVGLFGFQIEDDDIGVMLAGQGEALLGRFGFENLHSAAGERRAQHLAVVSRRIDDEDAGLRVGERRWLRRCYLRRRHGGGRIPARGRCVKSETDDEEIDDAKML